MNMVNELINIYGFADMKKNQMLHIRCDDSWHFLLVWSPSGSKSGKNKKYYGENESKIWKVWMSLSSSHSDNNSHL